MILIINKDMKLAKPQFYSILKAKYKLIKIIQVKDASKNYIVLLIISKKQNKQLL